MKLYLAIKAIGRVSAKSKAVVDDDGDILSQGDANTSTRS